MKNFDVIGVASSISPNKVYNYIAVGYFDESIITFHDYNTGAITGKINTNYCSAYNNLIETNTKYFVYLDESKIVKVLSSKTLELLDVYNLENYGNFGSINSLKLVENTL